VRDINNNGQVLGVSRFNATDSSKTFIWDNGEFTILDPGFPLLARRIKEAGHVVGTTGSNKGKFTFLGDIGEGVVQNHEDAFALGMIEARSLAKFNLKELFMGLLQSL
jgi:predicted ATPase